MTIRERRKALLKHGTSFSEAKFQTDQLAQRGLHLDPATGSLRKLKQPKG